METMAFRSIFAFSCLHLGFGPTISCENGQPLPTAAIPPALSHNFFVQLNTVCPNCCNIDVEPVPGQGILMAWNFATTSWSFLGTCSVGELSIRKWGLGMDDSPDGRFRPTIWLPYPCGTLTSQDHSLVTLSAHYRQSNDGPFESRVPGMLSYLNTILFLTPHLTPGVYNVDDHSQVAGLDFFGM